MPEKVKYTCKIIRGKTAAEFFPFFKEAAPMLEAYWTESAPPNSGPFEVYMPTKEEQVIPGETSFAELIVTGVAIIVGAYADEKLIGFGVAGLSRALWCRDLIGTLHTAYIEPEHRSKSGNLFMHAALMLRDELIARGAKHVYYEKRISQEPHRYEVAAFSIMEKEFKDERRRRRRKE